VQGLDFEHDCSSCSNLLAELPNLQSVLLDLTRLKHHGEVYTCSSQEHQDHHDGETHQLKNVRAARKSRVNWHRVTGESSDGRLKAQYDHYLEHQQPLKDTFFLTFDIMTSHKYTPVTMYTFGPRWGLQLKRAMAAGQLLSSTLTHKNGFQQENFSKLFL